MSQNLANMMVKMIHFRIVWYINQTNTLNMFILEIIYHNCHTGLATFHKHNFSVFMPMPQKVYKVALKVFQAVFSMHCVDKTMHHHTAHMSVWMQRCFHNTGWFFIASNTYKSFNVWIQRSLHDTGWPFSASNTHKPLNVWMQWSLHNTGWPFIASNTHKPLLCGCKGVSMTLDGLSLPQTHINHLMRGCKGVSMTLDGLSLPQTHTNHLKCGYEGVSRALNVFSVLNTPKTL